MRIDSCRKCGTEQKEYDGSQRCQTCGKEISQFVCARCQIITEPQYHIHKRLEQDSLAIII
ncbi:MAG: hypothetical protein EB150_04485 [Nitrososphaeria archaeon]|nr:hypothetical protein [Nitrososphaeria archaeon]NDB50923.1 hypothetical protein [Nitrosopumilaceae archaeon]NDB87996.1 hypothetical protein [Nitrososphaerota archaeon]NDB46322.1 hypothetical protein [Nitrososphaeria archaeon]NDB92403.1 hypothetical protein [Nitrososphaeria archaeon]